jgi:hypothetical protein
VEEKARQCAALAALASCLAQPAVAACVVSGRETRPLEASSDIIPEEELYTNLHLSHVLHGRIHGHLAFADIPPLRGCYVESRHPHESGDVRS